MKNILRIIGVPMAAVMSLSMTWSLDNGVLTPEDLRKVKSISENGFWRCFYANDVSISCFPGIDDSESPPAEVGNISIEAWGPGVFFVFDARRSWPRDACELKVEELNNLLAGEETVCLSSVDMMVEDGGRKVAATLDRVKTRKGCYSYFVSPDCPEPDDLEPEEADEAEL